MNIFQNKNNWLVTGGAGFIGSHLIENLIKRNQRVLCVDDLSSGSLKNLEINRSLKIITKKIQDLKLEELPNDLKGIFHLAAQPSAPKSIKNMFLSSSNNLLSSLKVWQIAKELEIPIVYASSSAIYGDLPIGDDQIEKINILSPYAMDKLTMENYAKLSWELYKTSSVGLRFFNVYGPRQNPLNPYSGVISIFLDRLLSGEKIILNGGHQTREFGFVSDVSSALLDSMNFCSQNKISNVFNVGTGRSIEIKNLLNMISKILKIKPEVINKELLKGDPKVSICRVDKLKDVMGIKVNRFYTLENGLELSLQYVKK